VKYRKIACNAAGYSKTASKKLLLTLINGKNPNNF